MKASTRVYLAGFLTGVVVGAAVVYAIATASLNDEAEALGAATDPHEAMLRVALAQARANEAVTTRAIEACMRREP